MDKKKSKADNILFVTFSKQSVPEFKENKSQDIVTYGDGNKYPEYLLDKFNRSSKHGAIVKSKANYIAGNGWQLELADGKKIELPPANRYQETFHSLVKKTALDIELYGGFFLQVIYNKAGSISDVIHVDYNKVRSNKDNTKFYVKDDWSKTSGKKETFDAFNPEKRSGTQMIYFKEYRPGIDTYTLPDYVQALSYIEADVLISDHVLNNANSGFTASKMIVFTDGEPDTDEEKKDIERRITDKWTGAKGSKLIVSFSNGKEQVPEVIDLGASDLTKEDFGRVDDIIEQNILTAHQATSPLLFGIKTEGQLGNSTELRTAFEIFKNTYVNAKQKNLEEVFGKIFEINGIEKLELADVEPVGFEFSENIIAQNMRRDEIRGKIGLPEEAVQVKTESQKILEALNSLSPLIATKVVEALSPEQLLSLIGVTPDPNKPAPAPPAPKEESDDQNEGQQFSKIDELVLTEFASVGVQRDEVIVLKKKKSFFSGEGIEESEAEILQAEFEALTKQEASVLDLIRKDKRITSEVIAKALKIKESAAAAIVDSLEQDGYIKSKTEKKGEDKQIVREVVDEKVAKAETRKLDKEIFVMYAYEGPFDDRNRPFCHKLMELDRLYSRGDIETLSQRLGYSVWERRGGFYHNPKTGKTTHYCRHYWQQQIVLKKKKK